MKYSYHVFTSLILVFFFLSCNENNVELSLDTITQQIIENGISVPEEGCDTAIAFPYAVNGYQTRIDYQDGSSKWCALKDSITPDKKYSIINLKVLPSDTNLFERKAILVVKATNGGVYNIKISQKPYRSAYPEKLSYTMSASGGDLTVKVKANCPFRTAFVWRIDGYGDSAHIRYVDWIHGDVGKDIEPSVNGEATLHFHVDLNTGWGRNTTLLFQHVGSDQRIRSRNFEIRQEPRTFQANEEYTIPVVTDRDSLNVVFGQDSDNLNRIKKLSIHGLVDMGDMNYFANFAKSYSLHSLDLSNTHFDRSGQLYDKEKSVSERMFFGSTCSNIAIPSNTVYIGKEAFADCNQLTCFTIPQSIRYIGDRAFAVCRNLKDITVMHDSKLSSIGDEAFNTGTVLNSLYIPSTVHNISDRAFVGLHTKELHVEWMVPPVLKEGFITKGCILYVPKGCADKYKSERFWKDCNQILEEP